MGKFDGVLLISDFDDTFCPTGGEVPAANYDAVRYFMEQGGRFTFATGRPHTTMLPQLREKGLPLNAPLLLANGAQVMEYPSEQFWKVFPLPRTIAADLRLVMDALPSLAMESYHGDEVYIQNPNEQVLFHMRRVGGAFPELPLDEMPQPWFKALFLDEEAVLRQAQEMILARWGDRYEAVFSTATLLEMTAKGCTKGGTALWLAGQLGIDRRHLYCIGDNQNDLPMLAAAAIGFAPEGCAPEVARCGAKIVRRCGDGAAAHVIELLDSLYGQGGEGKL